ncbi:MAG: hypothetical protein F4X98_01465 [Gammaproteobacteria bacterium]|nr:hypothetical protein [Gammaproteobacteria bacterium]
MPDRTVNGPNDRDPNRAPPACGSSPPTPQGWGIPHLSVALMVAIGPWQLEHCIAAEHVVPLFLSASDGERESFVRVINRSEEGADVRITATDDSGWRPGDLTLTVGAREAVHFNSTDFEQGNSEKGLQSAAGAPVEGDWRLVLDSGLDLEILSYIRTSDGMLSSMHDTVPRTESRHRVSTFNPGSNVNQVSRLRLVNPGEEEVEVAIRGIDDSGASPGADTRLMIRPGAAATFTAQELEAGSAPELDGGIGDGYGKWQLIVTADQPIWVMSLLDSPTGHLTNLSTPGSEHGPFHRVDLFPQSSNPDLEGFVRVINHGDESGIVRVRALDGSGRDYGTVELTLGTGRSAHFNSTDLEAGNANKGLPVGVGPGNGPWRLELETDLDIELLSYIRTPDGFLAAMHDHVPPAVNRHRVSTFNPARNTNQVSQLRMINPADKPVDVAIRGLDGKGESPGDEVRLTLQAHAARTLTAQDLESGEADGLTGALATGAGKWQLIVAADHPIRLMSLLASPTGHLLNLSTRPTRKHVGPITDRFEAWNTRLEPKSWWKESAPYSCRPTENPNSPWLSAGLPDLGGSDPLSLIRYYGNGSYVRYGNMGFAGCTLLWKYPRATYSDTPADPTYYTPEVDITVDIARVPLDAPGWPSEERVDVTLDETVDLLNQHVTPYYHKLSEGQFRVAFHKGVDFEVPGDGSKEALKARHREILGLDCTDWPCSDYDSGAVNRMLFVNVPRLGAGAWNGNAQIGLAHIEHANMRVIVHEIGHAWLFWPHSYVEMLWQPYPDDELGDPNPYSNPYDFMSTLKEKNGWRQSMPATLAINRYSAGWIPPENVALHVTASATYTLRRPYDGGYQFLVVHSGRPYAFTTLEVPDHRDPEYLREHWVYDPDAPDERRLFRYDGVLVSRYDQSTGTGVLARFGPAFFDRRNPNFQSDAGWGRDDHSLLVDGETRDIGGVEVAVVGNADGSYDVTLTGGRIAEFETWCKKRLGTFDTGCAFDEPR